MSKNIIIKEDGTARSFSNVEKLQTNLIEGGTQNWVPEDEAAAYVDLGEKNITENGTYKAADDGHAGYSEVKVSVVPNLGTLSVTKNGTYEAEDEDYDGYSKVTVKVKNSGGGGGGELITKTITENGTYDATDDGADGYSSVTVDVDSVVINGETDITATAMTKISKGDTVYFQYSEGNFENITSLLGISFPQSYSIGGNAQYSGVGSQRYDIRTLPWTPLGSVSSYTSGLIRYIGDFFINWNRSFIRIGLISTDEVLYYETFSGSYPASGLYDVAYYSLVGHQYGQYLVFNGGSNKTYIFNANNKSLASINIRFNYFFSTGLVGGQYSEYTNGGQLPLYYLNLSDATYTLIENTRINYAGAHKETGKGFINYANGFYYFITSASDNNNCHIYKVKTSNNTYSYEKTIDVSFIDKNDERLDFATNPSNTMTIISTYPNHKSILLVYETDEVKELAGGWYEYYWGRCGWIGDQIVFNSDYIYKSSTAGFKAYLANNANKNNKLGYSVSEVEANTESTFKLVFT